MKEIVDKLQEENLLFKSLKHVPAKELKSRKRINIYLGVDLKKYYGCIFHVSKKSRMLIKEAEDIIALHKKLEAYNSGTLIKKKYIYIQAPLCSKAKALLEERGWVVWLD